VADANVVSVLLDWRIILQAFDFVVSVPAKPIMDFDSSRHAHFVRGSGSYLDRSRAGGHVEIHDSADT
jgi:hypothetical protein